MTKFCGNCFNQSDNDLSCSNCGSKFTAKYSHALPVGLVIHNKYIVGNVLGSPGGFGIAYLAYDNLLQRKVVLKELFPSGLVERAEDSVTVQIIANNKNRHFKLQQKLFLDEARKLAKLENVNSVVYVTEFFSENGTAYFSMSLVDGISLDEYLRLNKVEYQDKINWLISIAEGMKQVHESGILHRDLKPENILITKGGSPVIIDFGNAKSLSSEDNNVGNFFAVSPNFGAPEQYANDKLNMGPWTDIYAFGALSYFCLTLNRPVDSKVRSLGDNLKNTLDRDKFPDQNFIKLIAKCMALDIRERFQSFSDVLKELLRFKTQDKIWTSFLPSNKLSNNILSLHAKIREGKKFPIVNNWFASFLQFLWFFSYGINIPGLMVSFVYIFLFFIFIFGGFSAYYWPFSIFVSWGFCFFPCLLYSNLLLYNKLLIDYADFNIYDRNSELKLKNSLSKSLSLNKTGFIYSGLIVLLFSFFIVLNLNLLQNNRDRVLKAMNQPELREAYSKFLANNEIAPDLSYFQENYNIPNFPNSELADIQLHQNVIIIVFNFDEVKGKSVRWEYDNQSWKCISESLPKELIPDMCS